MQITYFPASFSRQINSEISSNEYANSSTFFSISMNFSIVHIFVAILNCSYILSSEISLPAPVSCIASLCACCRFLLKLTILLSDKFETNLNLSSMLKNGRNKTVSYKSKLTTLN